MAKLILSMDGLVLKEYAITKERTTIGRKPHNDIQIDNLAVSGEHAVVVTILSDSFLEDLGSTNGTLVNGQPIKKHFLQNNDVVELGKYRLKYVVEASSAAKAFDFEKTMVLRPGAGANPPPPGAQAPAARSVGVSQPMPARPSMTQSQPVALASGARAGTGLGRTDPADTLDSPVGTAAPSRDKPLAGAAGPVTRSFSDELSLAPKESPVPGARTGSGVAGDTAQPLPGSVPPPLGGLGLPPAGQQSTLAGTGIKQMVGMVQILSGSSAGRELELTKALTTLGKPGVQVAVITKRPQGYFLTHVEGANFPLVNGKMIDAQARSLTDHDVIEIAGVKMEFYIKY